MTLDVATYSQILTILTQLATNYTGIYDTYTKMFYDDMPADVNIIIYDENGQPKEITVPNRAKDRRYILNGEGNPNGNAAANKGSIYQDTLNGKLYLNIDGTIQGWVQVVTENRLDEVIVQGYGSPEGVVTASKGLLYVDRNAGSLYMKTTSTGNTGWAVLSKASGDFANIDLSNLSSIGRAVIDAKENASNKVTGITSSSTNVEYPSAKAVYTFVSGSTGNAANKDLSNLTSTGTAKFDAKENVSNKVTTITSSSTDIAYPSAKAVYTFVNGSTGNAANKDLSNLTTTGERKLVPTQTGNANKYLTTNGTTTSWSDINTYFTQLASSGSINLVTNSLNYIAPTGAVTFVLPSVPSSDTKMNQILVQVKLSTVYSINVGTSTFFNNKTPDLSTAGSYNLIYEYDENNHVWVCGWMRK